MKLKILAVLIIFSSSVMAFSDTAKMIILMKAMENNQRKMQDQPPKEKEEISSSDRRISGKVLYTQAETDGQSIAIFETKECGKLGYVPTDYAKAKVLENAKDVNLKVKNCVIQDVTPNQ